MRLPTTLAACSVGLVGCVAVNTTQLGAPSLDHRHPRVTADAVVVYRTPEQVPGRYQELALLHASGSGYWTSEAGMYRKMREEAGRLGANAIILESMSEMSTDQKIVATYLNVDVDRTGKAVAIYVEPPVDFGENGVAVIPDEGAVGAPLEAPFVIRLEKGDAIPATTIEPAGVDQLKVTGPDGSVVYVSAYKIIAITDERGADWTQRVAEERRRVPEMK